MCQSSNSAEQGETVRLRQLATGETYAQAKQGHWASPDPTEPVPTPSPVQQRWETRIVGLLAPAFGRHTMTADAGPLGIRSVSPYPDRLVIRVDRRVLPVWARALVDSPGSTRGPRLAQLRWSTEGKGIALTDESTGALVVLDRTFPREWQTALATAPPADPAGTPDRDAALAAALTSSGYGFEASVFVRRSHLIRCWADQQGQELHLSVHEEVDGYARLFDMASGQPCAAYWPALNNANIPALWWRSTCTNALQVRRGLTGSSHGDACAADGDCGAGVTHNAPR